MEESSSTKRKKSTKEDDDCDTISKLPKVLIQHIFSLLPFKDVVRTSILSKTWEYLWTSAPNFIFNEYEDANMFMDFIDRAISLRRSSIKQFSIENCGTLDPFRVRRWITAAVHLDVEDLLIEFRVEESFTLPYCLFASESLTSLSLHVKCTLVTPDSISLSNLKHLSLEYLSFSTDEYFLSCCPSLETLRLVGCNWATNCCFIVCVPNLLKLEIVADKGYTYEVWKKGVNYYSQVTIFAPSLKCFHYKGTFLTEYCLYDVTSLEEGKIEFDDYGFKEYSNILTTRLYKLLKDLSNVKKLLLSSGAVEVLDCSADRVPYIPVFNNLSTLIFNSAREQRILLDCEAVMKILQNSPCLETLRFETDVEVSSDCKEGETTFDPTPPCFSSCLKRIELFIKVTHGRRKLSLAAIEMLLSRAVVLEKLVVCMCLIRWYADDKAKKKEKLAKKLTQIPRASPVCEIEFPDKVSFE